jgi:poly(3-hydroxyalkanoate) synthetase
MEEKEQREFFLLFRLWKSDALTKKQYKRYLELLAKNSLTKKVG